jgi:DNA-binding NarL/FixJ family response regulator
MRARLEGLDAGQQIKAALPAVKLIYLSMNADPEVAAESFRRGASAYLVKTCATSELVLAVWEALRGKTYLSESLPRHEVNYLRRRGEEMEDDPELTPRQREVLQLLAEGKLMKEIAEILNLQPRTVAFHKYRIMESLGVKTNADLVRYAVSRNMIAA